MIVVFTVVFRRFEHLCFIFVRADASFRNILSANILSLQEKGKLTALKNKWWKEKRGGGACQVGIAEFSCFFFI